MNFNQGVPQPPARTTQPISIVALALSALSILALACHGIVVWLYTESPDALSPLLILSSVATPVPLLIATGLGISGFMQQRENRSTMTIMALVIPAGLLILSCILLGTTGVIAVAVVATY